MVSSKGKRKILFNGQVFYWHIQKNDAGNPEIIIVSEDKSIYLKRCFDKELCIGPGYIRDLLERVYKDGFNKVLWW